MNKKIYLSIIFISCRPPISETDLESKQVDLVSGKSNLLDAGIYVDAQSTTTNGEVFNSRNQEARWSGDKMIDRDLTGYNKSKHITLSPGGFFYFKAKSLESTILKKMPDKIEIIEGEVDAANDCSKIPQSTFASAVQAIDVVKNTSMKVCMTFESKPNLAKNPIAILPIKPSRNGNIIIKLHWTKISGQKSIFDIQINRLVPKVVSNVENSNNSKRVLFIGDSHSVGYFGTQLESIIKSKQPNVKLTSIASCGSHSGTWMNGRSTNCGYRCSDSFGTVISPVAHSTPLLQNLLISEKPNLTVVALGSNMVPQSKTTVENNAIQLAKFIKNSGSKCVWVGPPDATAFTKTQLKTTSNTLRDVVTANGCVYVDSLQYTNYSLTNSDGLHYTGNAGLKMAKQWANSVYSNHIQLELSSLPTISVPVQSYRCR